MVLNGNLIMQPSEYSFSEFNYQIVIQSLLVDQVHFLAFISNSFANRLTNIKENHKFQKDGKEGERVEDPALGLRHITNEIKQEHDIKYAMFILLLLFLHKLFSSLMLSKNLPQVRICVARNNRILGWC